MIPAVLRGLCDDAAIFPPGLVPLAEAVPAHREQLRSEYAELVGPLVLSAASLDALPPVVADLPDGELRVSLTVPAPAALAPARDRLMDSPAVRLVSVEIALPAEVPVREALEAVESTLMGLRPPQGSGSEQDTLAEELRSEAPARLEAAGGTLAEELRSGATARLEATYIEVPRGDRRTAVLEALAGGPHRAKFRTGGVEAHLYPDERELAEAIVATVRLGLAYKATAGLHHAVRNTDPGTGFEQHGFLNLLLATEAAHRGEPVEAVAEILGERDGATIAAGVRALTPDRAAAARTGFVSFGTCSITDPLNDLLRLGLLGSPAGKERT